MLAFEKRHYLSRSKRAEVYKNCARTPFGRCGQHADAEYVLRRAPPKLLSDAKEHIVIRPLVYLREKDLARWCRIKGYDVIPKLCGADDVCRREMKEIIQRMDRETPGRVENIFRSLTRVAPSHLLDQTLFDFKDLEKERLSPETSEEA